MKKRFLLIVAASLLLAVAVSALAAAGDDAGYGGLLMRHVADGRVDYAGLKTDEARLDAALEAMSRVDPAALSPQAQFAYYINVYNAWTLKLILEHYPGIRSIKEAGSFFRSPWKRSFVRLRDGVVSLDDIEHGILRSRFHDPRVHFAVNCASKSCPPLADAPYRGETLDAQLDAATKAFINNPKNTFFKDGALHVSRIFDWYGEDFGGATGVWTFIRRFADPALAREMDAAPRHELVYDPYDWSLNGR
ncbi:protein of unknown function DUF547 [Solidesulfovibrio fructosivorans JJ]]|uniref:DUF547 domain-containing protein n=1 Tax=Solidesulfovibrio fructosivorans JJ] TaxID=596151 RepID=E1JU56_SOLFR|nr:DUF547 domain-containing protein [Solidesulfovibrio fructosivorans]EFL51986.1 protein of unknown function DUF547 [Solidesulfovibrio fructosivorans JJ]]